MSSSFSFHATNSWIVQMRRRLEVLFWQLGWQMPVLFPAAMVAGRGLFNSLFVIYLLWALCVGRSLNAARGAWTPAVLLLLLAYLPGVMMAEDIGRAWRGWSYTVAYSAVSVILLAVIARSQQYLPRLLHGLGKGALLMFMVALLRAGGYWLMEDTFIPRVHMRAVDFGFCLPFLLLWLQHIVPGRAARHSLIVLTLSGCVAFAALSDERAALLSLMVALLSSVYWVLRFSVRHIAAIAAMLLVLIVLMSGPTGLLRDMDSSESVRSQLDALSSERLTLWQQAWQHPPDNVWIGVGVGNVRHAIAVVSLPTGTVRHLHNVWLDAGYETGLCGVVALLSFLVFFGYSGWRQRYRLPLIYQQASGACMSAALAILVQSQLSISYASREFGIYMFLALGLMNIMHFFALTADE